MCGKVWGIFGTKQQNRNSNSPSEGSASSLSSGCRNVIGCSPDRGLDLEDISVILSSYLLLSPESVLYA
uniref:Uncharacterized protein n=1 Tax=Anguilla anguilla TaxID=7936 RepID=A0A0E9UFI5_ANGAN